MRTAGCPSPPWSLDILVSFRRTRGSSVDRPAGTPDISQVPASRRAQRLVARLKENAPRRGAGWRRNSAGIGLRTIRRPSGTIVLGVGVTGRSARRLARVRLMSVIPPGRERRQRWNRAPIRRLAGVSANLWEIEFIRASKNVQTPARVSHPQRLRLGRRGGTNRDSGRESARCG